MDFKIVKPTEENLKKAAKFLKNEGVLVSPTETVYGLIADAFCKPAVEKIFKIKNRPMNKALICNISSYEMLYRLTDCDDFLFKKMTKLFWPGPLTIVVKKKPHILEYVTGKREDVAIRFSNCDILKKLTSFCDSPLVVPSANISGEKSSSSFDDVYYSLKDVVDFFIDGGECEFKKESTIVAIKNNGYEILRQGAITKQELEEKLKV